MLDQRQRQAINGSLVQDINGVLHRRSGNIAFVVTDTKTLVVCFTGTFLIRYDHRNYAGQLKRLRDMICRNEIKSMAELIEYCQFKPGNYRGQMSGLQLIPTKLERHV